MSDNAGNNQLITVDAAKIQISVALTKVGLLIQNFHTRKSNLVLNEDQENLDKISEFIGDKKKAKKVIEENHTVVKKPYFEAGKAVDKAKNELIALLDGPDLDVETWYNSTMNDIDRRKREAEEKRLKEQQIKTGVESNILDFSTKIAGARTRKELTDVERLINLEKSPSRSVKYGEWHQFAIDRYDTVLLPILKDQKTKVDEYEKLQEELAKANNPIEADKIKVELEAKDNEILQNQVKVQEDALNQQQMPQSNEVEEILPDITKAGGNMTCEIIDLKKVFQKHLELLNIDLRLVEAKKLGATLRAAGSFDDNDELVIDGLKFKYDKRWK